MLDASKLNPPEMSDRLCRLLQCAVVWSFAAAIPWNISLPACGQVAEAAKPLAGKPPAKPSTPAATAATTSDTAAIHAAAAAYMQALERGDGNALAALWTADGDIVDEQGNVLKGRDTVALTKKPTAEHEPPTLLLRETTLRFLTPDVAIEDGTVQIRLPGLVATVFPPKVIQGRFTATWLKQEGQWHIASLREAKIEPAGGPVQLADLDWMVGDWTVVDNTLSPPEKKHPADPAVPANADNAPSMEIAVRWNAARTFLLRDMKIIKGQTSLSHISQRIGWDPLAREIHSWMFAGDGAHGEGVWKKDGDAWIAQASSVMADGTQMSSLNIYVYNGKDRCTWRSFHTHIGGEHLPQVNMTMIRKPGSALQ